MKEIKINIVKNDLKSTIKILETPKPPKKPKNENQLKNEK